METIIVDRIEDKQAVCEFSRGEFRNIPLSELPYGVKEGSVLTRGNVCGKWALDAEKEKEVKERWQLRLTPLLISQKLLVYQLCHSSYFTFPNQSE